MPTSAVATEHAVILEPGVDELHRFGGKGAALARLVAIHQPVPPTGVVTTAAYEAVAAANETIARLVNQVGHGVAVPEAEVDTIFREAVVPAEVEQSIVNMVARVGGPEGVAVRSSATVEDLAGSSFAGQYRSLLNIDSEDPEAVMQAVREVWASLWYPAPSAYRAAFGIESIDVAMGVVVMAMIPATTAGVVFTADPGGSGGARVEAVEGLGESLVSGERTPSAWVVPTSPTATSPRLPRAAERALELSRQVERAFGVPQDVEWAADGDTVYVVQARPITVLETDDGFDSDIDDHELTSAGIAELVPGVLPPLRWELNAFLLEQAFRSVLDSLGAIRGASIEDSPFIRRVRGRAALDFDQLRVAASDLPGAVAELELQYFGKPDAEQSAPTKKQRLWQRLERDLRTARTRRLVIEDADVLVAAVAGLRGKRPELAPLDNDALLRYHRRLLDLAARGLIGELGVAAAGGASYDRLVTVLDSYLGDGEGARAAQVVTAHSGATVDRDPCASAAVFAGPTWKDLDTSPPSAVEHDPLAYRDDLQLLEERIRTTPGWRRRRFLTGQFIDVRMHIVRRTVSDVVEQLQRREAAKAAFLEIGGEVRRVHMALGTRLVERGVLQQPDDIELLSTTEITDALHSTVALAIDAIRRRRNWLSRYDVEGQLPLRFRGVPDREPKPLPVGDVLEGWAASPGRHRGRARIVRHADGAFESGEILVAEATDASWSPLFVRAGAVVVERGGPLSHAAILARELGLPAVLNVEGATRILEGCTVSVDGDQGVVVIEQRGEQP